MSENADSREDVEDSEEPDIPTEDGRISAPFVSDVELDPDDPVHIYETLTEGDRVKFRAEGADVFGGGYVMGHRREENSGAGILYVRVVADPAATRTTEFRLESRRAPATGRWTDLEVRSMPYYPRTGEREMRDLANHGRVTDIQRVSRGEVHGDRERSRALERVAITLEAAAKRARLGRPYSALNTVEGLEPALRELAMADLSRDAPDQDAPDPDLFRDSEDGDSEDGDSEDGHGTFMAG